MAVLPYIALVCAAATLLSLWCGWGLSRLTLPASLKPWGGVLAALTGYALVLLVGYLVVRTFAGLPVALLILVPGAGILNLVAWVRTGAPKLPEKPLQHLPLLALLLATLLVGVAPLISYGHPAVIGSNWDTENYLPTARYLEQGPISAIATAPPNPLRDINAKPPAIGLTLGFSVWHGSTDLLTGSDAINSFAIVLAWLRMLGVAGVYVLFRSLLALKRPFALLGAAFTSAGALFLWVSYFNFGMQVSAWPLLPLGLTVGIAAVEDGAERRWRAWPALLGAAIVLAAMPVAYYPALTLFAPLAAGLGIVVLLRSKQRLRLLGAAVALGAAVLVLSIPAVLDYMEGFAFRYSQQLTTLGLFRYIPLTDVAGLTPFSLQSEGEVPAWALAALVVLTGLMVAGLVLGPERWRWAGLVAGAALYLAWIRWGQQYPYAYMKGAAYAAFPLVGLAAAGVQGIADRWAGAPVRWAASALGLVVLGVMAASQWQTVAEHWEAPGLYAMDLPGDLQVRGLIHEGSRVTLSSDPRMTGPTAALAAYLLQRDEVLGSTSTGYVSSWSNGGPDELGDYALLLAGEDPAPAGFALEDRLWQGGSFALYRRAAGALAHLPLELSLDSGQSLNLPVSASHLVSDTYTGSSGPSRQVALALAAFRPGRVSAGGRGIDIPAGGSLLTATVGSTPEDLQLRNDGPEAISVRWATLLAAPADAQPGPIIVRDPATALAQAAAKSNGSTIATTMQLLSPGAGPVTAAIDVWDLKRGLHYGWYGVEQPRREAPRTVTLTLDLQSGKMTGMEGAGAPVVLGGGPEAVQRGDYVARLNLLAGTRLIAPPADLFSFSLAGDGSASNVRAGSTAVLGGDAGRPSVPLDVQADGEVRLLGYDLESDQVAPGQSLQVTLWWEALSAPLDERSVLIHLRDPQGEKRAQADGPPADGGRPTSTWQKGEVIVDTHSVALPADLPEGDYSLVVGMYHYPSLDLVPLSQGSKPLPGNTISIPVRVRR